jgi:hypothetical protein
VAGDSGSPSWCITTAYIADELFSLDLLNDGDRDLSGDDSFHREAEWGRVLTIGPADNPFAVIDASPKRVIPTRREQVEEFIDAVLAALAGR